MVIAEIEHGDPLAAGLNTWSDYLDSSDGRNATRAQARRALGLEGMLSAS